MSFLTAFWCDTAFYEFREDGALRALANPATVTTPEALFTRLRMLEAALAGGASIADAAALAADGTEAPHDINASVEYREHLAKVLVRRALEESSK